MNGDSIKAIRISRNMSQEEFAGALSVSRSCIAAVETGRRIVSHTLRVKIAQVFGTGDDVLTAIQRAKDSDKLAL